MGASRAGTPENGGYTVAPCRGGDNGLAADLDVCCVGCGPLLYDCGVSTGLKMIKTKFRLRLMPPEYF